MKPSSDGIFISVDGPSGVGKSATVQALAQLLQAEGRAVHVTGEPSDGPIGRLAYDLTDTVHGAALACLYAADRYHHLSAEVLPQLRAGAVVVTDRYIPSALVMQQLDGVDPDFLWRINSKADRPHLAVLLNARPEVVAARLSSRGAHNRLQRLPSSSHIEWHHYQDVAQRLADLGWTLQCVDCSTTSAEQVAQLVYDRLCQLERSAS
jgi:dTMP kinase